MSGGDEPVRPAGSSRGYGSGDQPSEAGTLHGITGYVIGLLLAVGLSAVSFWIGPSHLVWAPSIPVALIVLAIAQMGVHLVFFLHITTGRDNTNNVLALAFGILIVSWCSRVALDHGQPRPQHAPIDEIMRMQR